MLPENARARACALFGWFSKSRAHARARALFGWFSKSCARALFARKCLCPRALGPWPVPFFQKFTKCSVTRSNFVQNARYAPEIKSQYCDHSSSTIVQMQKEGFTSLIITS
jgi:hypothetical protein